MQLRQCTYCAELVRNRTQVVPGHGHLRSRIVFVGEAPGRQEDLLGKPFVGRAGNLLDEMLKVAGLRREDVWITNTIKCRPPDNRTPTPQEVRNCSVWLEQELALIQPIFLVVLGRTALDYFLPNNPGITRARGRCWKVPGRSWPLFATFHPAAVLRDPAKQEIYRQDFQEIGRLARELRSKQETA